MKRIAVLFSFGACWALLGASDRVPKIDLDNGVTITGNGRAAFTNPAALADFQGTLLDVGFYKDSDFGILGHLSQNLAENIGIGVGVNHIDSFTAVTPGLGFTVGKMHVGGATTFYPGSSGLGDFTIGFRYDKSEDLSLGVVAYDVPHFKVISAGIGVFRSQKVMGEVDVNLVFNDGYDLRSGETRVALSFKAASSVWMLARLTVPVAPDIVFDRHRIELGLHTWLSSNAALYLLYQNQTPWATLFAGLKLKI